MIVEKSDMAVMAAGLTLALASGAVMEGAAGPLRLARAPSSEIVLAAPMVPREVVAQAALAQGAAPSMPAVAAGGDCSIVLDLLEQPNAMIGVTLQAPCHGARDVIIAHAGLMFAATTMETGALFLSMPALTPDAEVKVHFAGGDAAEARIAMPEAVGLRRFAVQWPDLDGFAIHAYENRAGFDDPGHIWAQNMALPIPNLPPASGYLTLLGDPLAEMPMLAQVYTYPNEGRSEVVVEAEVTLNNCGGDLTGEVISMISGNASLKELSVAMPDCASVGEFVQIGGLAPDPNFALLQ